MHFRFLGGQDCPDWLLAQISECSKVSSVKFRKLCQISVDYILNGKATEEDLERFVSEHIESSDVKRLLYSISFMMKNAVSYNCDAKHFETECTHLGLPPEHSKVIAREYTANVDVLKQYVKDSIPKETSIETVTVNETGSTPSIRYVRDGKTTICSLTPGQLSSLRQDMSLIQNIIETKFER
ncbi:COMM domain-containing protein 4 [Parelaphostrongylus tenuis]|uniref:COMM domain-containing protein 4 n=1 Tax=Parelaphostrongylus tenuis TaxID=148309 RepID=A0AAD5MRT6_PARTN|nr:COMM domain-containing protein 4 [Parelaphostrongylus tenuis]